MSGAPDPLYIAARHTLLDALDALRDHQDAIVLVGAQAVYLHSGDADLAVAPYTTDGDLALDPGQLRDSPLLEELLAAARFHPEFDVGRWSKQVAVDGVRRSMIVDLLVPSRVSGSGRRGARIPPHGDRVARKVSGLEGALVDRDRRLIEALDTNDERRFEIFVAGPAALMVAKVFKIRERVGSPDRLIDKDALDVLRLLRAVPTDELVRRVELMRQDDLSRDVANSALQDMTTLFGSASAAGCTMAARAAYPLEAEATIRASAATLANDLMRKV
ncbi:MAG: hypothetical protein WEF86_02090 [Gemmatimonadota bacterium]